MTHKEAYSRIIRAAIPIANTDNRLPYYLQGKFGPPPPSQLDGISLWYDPHIVANVIYDAQLRRGELKSTDELYALMATVVRDAVQKACHKEWQAVGFLMLEDLKNAATSRTDGTLQDVD